MTAVHTRLIDSLRVKSNDYGQFQTGRPVVSLPSCSLIIPFHGEVDAMHMTLAALRKQVLNRGERDAQVECIVVNDGTETDLAGLVADIRACYPVTCINIRRSVGRAMARNIAIAHARHEVLIFLDADMVVPSTFLTTHLSWHQIAREVIVVGFRENLTLAEVYHRRGNPTEHTAAANYRADFRYRKFVPSKWAHDFPDIPRRNFNRTYMPLDATTYFRDFGFNRTVGVWQLPSMVLASNMSVRRDLVVAIGGFDSRFVGWGMEDTHLAAKLIAAGAYVIPDMSLTTYHIVDHLSEELQSAKQRDLSRNLPMYRALLREPLRYWTEAAWIDHVLRSVYTVRSELGTQIP